MNVGIRLFPVMIGYLAFWALVTYLSSVLTGWHTLARRFRFQEGMFQGAKWGFRTGYTRFHGHYGNCLTVGADLAGLYLAVWPILRIGSPPLLIPWSEVSVMAGTKGIVYRGVKLRLGREEKIPLRLKSKTIEKLKQAAGAAWPMETAAVQPALLR